KVGEILRDRGDVFLRGGGDAAQGLRTGRVERGGGSLGAALPHIKAGTFRCLAICGDSRWPELPAVPTMAEVGYEGFNIGTDMVLLAPAKTPSAEIKLLENATLKVLLTAEMKDKLFQAGFLVRAKGADAAWARVTKEITTFKQIIDQAGITKL